ncbi:nuclear transport factor 2 family protein [Adhaeribacter rhizoryzae]|uniref:Nuclear transport factor 2 family protein n=1 Tax=Adhaeribacter rhizoryzae TaxID=2607907 RepID=A0A5M6D2C0_9BACT|nr:nuclear transport factor 2 family protein [Adhaeribacter rhizoryzae]KAA5541618.1 nuclear transport factor 2 family protein [Adhaeribacter rhizoryzae]
MKSLLLACLLFLTVTVASVAQTADEKAVAVAVTKLKSAMLDPTKSNLNAIAMAELTYGHSNGLIEDKAAFMENLLSGKSDFVKIDLTDQTVKVAGNSAWVRHTLSADTKNSGVPGTTKLSVLLVWQKVQGQWKLLARQAVKV